MIKLFKRFVTLLIIGILIALGYIFYKNGFIPGSSDEGQTEEADGHERNLDWLNDIRGYSDEETSEEDTEEEMATSPESDLTTTSTEQGSDEDGLTEDEISGGEGDEDRVRSVENLGKGDALESTVYDHAFDKLILFAELRKTGIALEWNPTESESFDEYKIVRSTSDENPYYPKTSTIKTLSNINSTTYFDSGVQSGMDYYYSICFTKVSGRPVCGNILKVSY
jgi:hypothetical protein